MALATVFQKDFEDFSQTNPLSQTYQRFGGNRAAVYPETEEEGRERRAMTSEYRTTRLQGRKQCIRKAFTAQSAACPQATAGWSRSQGPAFLQRLPDLKAVTPTGHLRLQGSELCLKTRKGLAMQKSLERKSETRETGTQTPA